MRLFTAISLPDQVRSELAAIQPHHPDINLTPESQLHLTLRYIGETDKAKTRRIINVLSYVTFRPFDITIRGTGSFRGDGPPAIFWAGVPYHSVLSELYESIQEELHRAGVPYENRTFHPHVTLGRVRKRRKGETSSPVTPSLERVQEDFFNGEPSQYSTTFHVDRFRLYQSRFHSGGAIHHCLREYMASEEVYR